MLHWNRSSRATRSRRSIVVDVAVVVLLTAASGLAYGAAFPPIGLHLLAWVALAPFFAASLLASKLGGWSARRGIATATGLGFLWALCMGYSTAYWLPEMLSSFFGATTAEGWAGFAAIALALVGTYTASLACLTAWLARRGPVSPLVLAAGWTTCEFARAHLLVPNPWALSAYTQIEWGALIQIADLSGPWGLSFLIGWSNAAIALALLSRTNLRRTLAHTAAILSVLLACIAYGEWRLGEGFATGEELDVAIVQGGVARPYWLDPEESDPGRRVEVSDAQLSRYLELARIAGHEDPDLVVLPEGALDFSLAELSARSLRVFALARELDGELIVGAPRSRSSGDDVAHFNSVFLLRRGVPTGTYDKVELMPFSETNPLRAVANIGTDRYSAGTSIRMLRSSVLPIGTMICSEAMLPGHVRRVVHAGAQVLVNPSNDYWFAAESASRLQLAATSFRAIESRRWVVRATSTGTSALVSPTGRVVSRSGFGTAEILRGTVRGSSAKSPYQRVGDGAAWIAVALCMAAWLKRIVTRSAPVDEQEQGEET